jgi:hypothetical protein
MSGINDKLKICKFCKKELNIADNTIPPTWYGKYDSGHKENDHLIEVACPHCLAIEVCMQEWRSL